MLKGNKILKEYHGNNISSSSLEQSWYLLEAFVEVKSKGLKELKIYEHAKLLYQ